MEDVAGAFGRRGRQRRRVPSYAPHINNIPQGRPIASGALPGSPESHKGTKLLFDEDLLRLIASPALSKEVEVQEKGDNTQPSDGHCKSWLCLQTAQSGKTCGA